MVAYTLEILNSIDALDRRAWNRLASERYPFLRHEFLAALEHQGCVGERHGWLPHHLLLRDQTGTPRAAAPCYLKFNSYGELVFDWAWADAHQRAGLPYYPKLVVASPYTPATGPRLLVGDDPQGPEHARALVQAAREHAARLGVSSLHVLFAHDQDTHSLERGGFLRRMGCQFHWHNPGYRDFEDFLARFTAEKRKKVHRERRRVTEAGIRFRVLPGHAVSEAEWVLFHRLYCDTFAKRGGIPTLSLGFFQELASTMGEQLLLVLALDGTRVVAGAFSLVGADTLYGRHWGCFEDYHSLHFEACYYQGLEFCIRAGLTRFEPGAQGEHKVSRGFLPTPTWSAHWLREPRFQTAIGRFLAQETAAMTDYAREMQDHSPYKASHSATP